MDKNPSDFVFADVLLEVLEVAINLILYVRNIYPEGIFERCQKYNINVMMSKHPEVNSYIADVLQTMKKLMEKELLEKVVVQISTKDNEPVERFCFELKLLARDTEHCYFDMETHLRALLLKLNTCDSMLKPLPPGCSFQVLAHTKQSSLKYLEGKADFENFPWVIAEHKSKSALENALIIPVRSCSTEAFIIQCYVEERHEKTKNSIL